MNQAEPKIDIVVCSYKNREMTAKCLDSLLDSTYIDYGIILVDDCSPDDTAEFFRKNYPQVTVIKNEANLGPAVSRNRGINSGHAEYVVTMDNDATLSRTWLEQIMELMESNKTIGQAVGKILFASDTDKIAAAGGSMLLRGKGYDIGLGERSDDERFNQLRPVLYACSASMIIRRRVLQEIGGFYEGFYHGYEDTDLSLRVNIAGYKVIYQPEALSYHALSTTVNQTISKKRTYLWMRNRLLIMLRNYQLPSLVKAVPQNLRFNLSHCMRQGDDFAPFIKSLCSVAVNAINITVARHQTRNFRKINDIEVQRLFNLH